MDEKHDQAASSGEVTRAQAVKLLASIPAPPKRQLKWRDRLFAAIAIVMGMFSGLLALSGHPWWAVIPGAAAIAASNFWITDRRARPNEPRIKAGVIATIVFTTWLTLPIWRGITRGDTVPFPEAWTLAGLPPRHGWVFTWFCSSAGVGSNEVPGPGSPSACAQAIRHAGAPASGGTGGPPSAAGFVTWRSAAWSRSARSARTDMATRW